MFEWLQENLLFCGMVGSGVFGLLCVAIVNHFYNKTMRDLRQMKNAKGKWTKEFLNEYQNRSKNQQKIKNVEVFVRAQLIRGKVLGITLQKWKQSLERNLEIKKIHFWYQFVRVHVLQCLV